jgi:hypothetical protein
MIGRRAGLGLSLLCLLVFCAIGVQGASAAPGKNTTGFTCVEKAEGDFKDAHCDEKVPLGEGKFAHVAIANGVATKLVVTNKGTKNATKESTPGILKGELAGAKLEIICETVSGEGTATNEEVGKEHKIKSSGTTKFTICKVIKPAKCTVKEPIEVAAEGEGVEELGAGKNEMGGEIKPAGGGKTFISITLEGPECALKGTAFNVEGTAIVTGTPLPAEKHSGSTGVLTNAMTKETLKIGGKPAEISAVVTARMAPVEGKEQNPVSATTST